MKVKTKRGGFFYDGRAIASNEELEVSKEVGESWIENDLAEEAKPAKTASRSKKPSEDTADARAEGREKRA